MRSTFPLFQSHLDLSYTYWKTILKPGDLVIDATCGNGKDTLKLAQLVIQNGLGKVYAFDIQKEAILSAQTFLSKSLSQNDYDQVHFFHESHENFANAFLPESIKLIVYNLGYLPGGNKQLTTNTKSTLTSIEIASSLICHEGAISITCYPGHPEGKREEEEILKYVATLNPMEWSCCHHKWINRESAPSLLLIQRKVKTQLAPKS